MTLQQSLSQAQQKLKKARLPQHTSTLRRGVLRNDNIISDAEILLCHVLKKDKAFLYTYPEKSINNQQLTKYIKYINRRAKGEPIAYLTEHKEFNGLDFMINKNVLIPRPETEIMVEQVIKQLTTSNQQPTTLIDIGTGCGNILISILKKLPITDYQLPITALATDISPKALSVACHNAKLHKVDKKIKFIQSDLLKNIQVSSFKFPVSNLILTANLPYLPYKIYRQNYSHLKYEPQSALLAKNHGLALYIKLLKQIKSLITRYALRITIYIEILPFQTKTLTKLVHNFLPLAKIKIIKDYAGQNRIFMIKFINKTYPQQNKGGILKWKTSLFSNDC